MAAGRLVQSAKIGLDQCRDVALDQFFTPPKELVNWPARSLIRNLTVAARWPRSIMRFWAACVVHAPSGFAVMPARWTRQVPCSITISA